ncbi:uncharacterized protein [Ranitomeya imitator]|uniref:uncharacterized protein isoform X3 n=1 Tax=Ranitomeya imitator TaxID=111125 RepID=UPI0037E974DF
MITTSYFLEKHSTGDRGHDAFILELLRFVLEKNYFIFDRTFYKQASGTAMGAKCAPSYANLFMGWWEETHVQKLRSYSLHVIKWLRFIDDIIIIWSGTSDELGAFIEELNNNCWNIKLTTTFSTISVDFLDLRVSMDQNRIVTTLFRKQTATNNLLHFESFHPSHLRRGIPKGQFLRLRRNCTRTEDFCMEARQLTNRFRERGYPKKIISGAFEFSRTRTREEALQPRVRTETNKINLITKFNNQWNDIYHILKKNWGILRSEPKLRPFIGDRPQMVARRARNLKDHLTNSHFRRPTTKIETSHSIKGSFPCGSCSICPRMIAGEGVRVHNLPTRVQSRTYFNCRTRNLIYALICSCEKIYVGQTTQELRRRTQQHLSSIATARTDRSRGKIITSVAKHFLEVHAGSGASLRVMGLEKVNTSIRGRDPVEDLLCREARWIYELDCLVPQGLNEELLYSGFYKRK